jgi:hypothetical protein
MRSTGRSLQRDHTCSVTILPRAFGHAATDVSETTAPIGRGATLSSIRRAISSIVSA